MLQVNKYGKVSKHMLSMSILMICGLPSMSFAEGLGAILHRVEQAQKLLRSSDKDKATRALLDLELAIAKLRVARQNSRDTFMKP